jgi:hypothetical protein
MFMRRVKALMGVMRSVLIVRTRKKAMIKWIGEERGEWGLWLFRGFSRLG